MRLVRHAFRTPVSEARPSIARVLVADPNGDRSNGIGSALVARGYHVVQAESGTAAVEWLRVENFAVLICDRWSNGTSGFEVVPRALNMDPDLAVIVISAVSDLPSAADQLSSGAYDFLRSPVDPEAIARAVEKALQRRSRELERRRVDVAVRETVIQRTVQIEKEKAALRKVAFDVVHSLVEVLEAKDPLLHGHSDRVAALAARIAEHLNLSADHIESIRLAGRLHDVGMVGIPEHIIRKATPLTAGEFATVKTHVNIGMSLLAPINFAGDALTYVRDHHEQYDGGGYPRRLAGNAISLGGRILAAADAYDALTSARIYRPAHSPAQALEILGKRAGKHLDPDVYRTLSRVTGGTLSFTMI